MEFGIDVESLFARGIDAWTDIEVAKNYAANDPRPATRDANGNAIPQGTPGVGFLTSLSHNPLASSLAIAVVAGLIVWLVARKL